MSLATAGEPVEIRDGYAVYRAGPAGLDDWDEMLAGLSGGAPFATSAWYPVLENAFGATPVYLRTRRESAPAGWEGCLAGYVNRDWTGRTIFYGVRQGLFGAPAAVDALIAAAEGLARAAGCDGFDLNTLQPYLAHHPDAVERTVFRLPLDPDADAMWSRLRDKTRNMIRRAQKSGLTVRELAHERASFDLLARHNEVNLLPKGVAVPDPEFFTAVCGTHGERAHILAAELDGAPVASMLMLRHAGLASYPVQNADPTHRKLAPIQLLTWEAMLCAAAHGCSELDMGESAKDSPVYKSKRNFGGIPTSVSALRCPLVTGGHGNRVTMKLRTVWDKTMMNLAPRAPRRAYARWRYRRGRIL